MIRILGFISLFSDVGLKSFLVSSFLLCNGNSFDFFNDNLLAYYSAAL